MSFEQWYHEVQCVKDHYHELFIRGSIIHLLKGAAADIAHYVGPISSVYHIVKRLPATFGIVATFDILMQNIYNVSQKNIKKVLSYVTRLELLIKFDSSV